MLLPPIALPTYVISCPEDKGRHALARQYFDNLPTKVRWWRGIHAKSWQIRSTYYDNEGKVLTVGHVGNCLSHWSLWQHLYHARYEQALILEDDAVFEADFTERYHGCMEELKAHEWDIFFLGFCWADEPQGWDGLLIRPITNKSNCVHAYIVTKKALEVLIVTCAQAKEPIDMQVEHLAFPHLKCFRPHKELIKQRTVEGLWQSSTAK